jgi:hypothetical protein
MAKKINPKTTVKKISKTIGKTISDATNKFLIDLETNGLIKVDSKLNRSYPQIAQAAVGNMQTGENRNWYVNQGSEEANQALLDSMQNLRDTNGNLTEVADYFNINQSAISKLL